MASRSFTGNMVFQPDSLNVPILKFSYSTTPTDRASPLGWTHLSSNGDLAVVFDHILTHETSSAFSQGDQRLRVLRGGDILEQLNLNSLAREAATGPSYSFAQNMKPRVAIIVKSPCLAVRYPMRNDQTRRFQIKFSSDADYSSSISILSKLGCPITHSAAIPPRSLSSLSQTPSLIQIGGGTHPLSPGLSTRPTGDRPWSSSLTEPSTSASFISSFNSSSTNASSYDQAHGMSLTSTSTIPGIATASSPNLGRQEHSPTSFHAVHPNVSFYSSKLLGVSQNDDRSLKERPATAPVLPDPDPLSQVLPPKRELPFAKPETKSGPKQPSDFRGPSDKQIARPAQSSALSSFSISQSRASASNPISEDRSSITSQSGRGAVANGGDRGSSANPNLPFRRPVPRDNLGGNTHDTGRQSTGIAEIKPGTLFTNKTLKGQIEESDNVSKAETTSTPAPATSTTPQPLPERSAGAGFVSLTRAANKDGISPSDLSAYLSKPNPERTALVESWICSQLENDAFLSLCQDVEGVWRRIAFGY